MRTFVRVVIVFGVIAALVGASAAREGSDQRRIRIKKPWSSERYAGYDAAAAPGAFEATAAVDTYAVVNYDFETKNWQGWTRRDCTAQRGMFFHVDDFAGLGGGVHGLLAPIQGTKSMWCGVRPNPNDPYVCNWQDAPGYGNDWDQNLAVGITVTGPLTLSYRLVYDTEPGYDFVRVQNADRPHLWEEVNWQDLAVYTGSGDTTASHTIYTALSSTKLRFHFESDNGWSDQDGLLNTDGACILDELHLTAPGIDNYEDFETAPVGSTHWGWWTVEVPNSFGAYSGVRYNLTDRDPCGDNLSSQITFFDVNCLQSGDPDFWLCDTPFCRSADWYSEGGCQNEYVMSPVIDMSKYSTAGNNVQDAAIPAGELARLGGATLEYTVYRDLPRANLVFYSVEVYPTNSVGCTPGNVIYDWWLYDGADNAYLSLSENVPASGYLKVAFHVIDMCSVWYLIYGDCAEHTPTPWFDNVTVKRYSTAGPQWRHYEDLMFQDNFPADEAMEGYVRADAAADINPASNPLIHPGDSIIVDCGSPVGGGIALDAGGPRIFMHARCKSIGYPTKPLLAGPALEGTYGHYVSDDGAWTIIQGDTSYGEFQRIEGGYRVAFDLNDSLFTGGYMIEYYFKAYDNAGESSALPKGADQFAVESPYAGSSYYFEFTCLPTGAANALYVDDFDGIGSFNGVVQDYFDRTFKDIVTPPGMVDRYDVLAPTSMVGNGLASRVRASQLDSVYSAIVWDSGDLTDGTIADGTAASGDKTNDCQLLVDFLDLAPAPNYQTGVWILGDNVAEELTALSSPQALALMNAWCGVSLVNASYFGMTGGATSGGVVNPLLTGASSLFVHGGIPDKLYLFGGCPGINGFDVLGAGTGAECAFRYPDYDAGQYCAAVQAAGTNPNGATIHTMWFAFSFMSIRDCFVAAPIIRNETAQHVLRGWIQSIGPRVSITEAEAPKAYRLAQNYPNPFNPSTTIKYDMKAKGLVTVRIYDVAGRLVRTLVNEVKDAGAYSAVWDGRNNGGAAVASGIYFYKMETGAFSATKKLVLLR
jgi:hypothetical protein